MELAAASSLTRGMPQVRFICLVSSVVRAVGCLQNGKRGSRLLAETSL